MPSRVPHTYNPYTGQRVNSLPEFEALTQEMLDQSLAPAAHEGTDTQLGQTPDSGSHSELAADLVAGEEEAPVNGRRDSEARIDQGYGPFPITPPSVIKEILRTGLAPSKDSEVRSADSDTRPEPAPSGPPSEAQKAAVRTLVAQTKDRLGKS